MSSPQSSHAIHAILEQLYEDLNSYSEASIEFDDWSCIDLKMFPFYPNPPEVKDWMVPIALINLSKRIEQNWDLTMAKVIINIPSTFVKLNSRHQGMSLHRRNKSCQSDCPFGQLRYRAHTPGCLASSVYHLPIIHQSLSHCLAGFIK